MPLIYNSSSTFHIPIRWDHRSLFCLPTFRPDYTGPIPRCTPKSACPRKSMACITGSVSGTAHNSLCISFSRIYFSLRMDHSASRPSSKSSHWGNFPDTTNSSHHPTGYRMGPIDGLPRHSLHAYDHCQPIHYTTRLETNSRCCCLQGALKHCGQRRHTCRRTHGGTRLCLAYPTV